MKIFWLALGIGMTICVISTVNGQTNPTPQQVPMSQDFGNLWFSTAGLPQGFAVWKVSGAPSTTQVSASNSTPNGNEIIDTATVVKGVGKAYGYSGVGTGGINVNNGQLYIQTSSSTSGTDQLALALNTTGFTNIRVSFEIEMINPQPKKTGVVLQYRIGTSGTWTIIDTSYNRNNSDRLQNQIDYFVNLPLGVNANNQSVVQLRWAISRDVNPAGSGSCGLAIDNIVVSGDPISPPQYFRTVSSGNWNSISIWESSLDGITWLPATKQPTTGDLSVRIVSPHIINTAGISNIVIDEVTIDAGAVLKNSWGTALAIEDGPSSVDLLVNGVFEDSSSISVVWVNTARWQMGVDGTFIKTYNTNSTNWQLKYFNGISTIPATSNWICRKAFGSNVEPSISTTNGGSPFPQATYGNLYIENNASTWNPTALCKFSGSNNTPLIKGNLYIGGNGSGIVSFLCTNLYSLPVKVVGNIFIAAGSTLRNEGTGFELQGDLICNGLHSYGTSTSSLLFSGANIQTISGLGTVNIWKAEFNKSANETSLLNTLNVFGVLNLVSGVVNTSSLAMIDVKDNALSTNASNNSFVRGPLKKTGNDAFIFPVGKGNLLRTIAMDVGTANVNDVFVAEYYYQNPKTVYGNVIEPSLDHISSCEYWTLDQSAGSSAKKVTLSWSSNSCGVSGLADLRVARYNNILWVNEGNSATTGNFGSGTVKSNTTTGFGPFTLASVSNLNPLPIELISFDAKAKNDHVFVSWITATEINNDYFTIEKSKDGINFLPIGKVKGSGNSTQVIEYQLNDENPLSGVSYYRLKQTDYDGKFSVSNIVAVKMNSGSDRLISILPQREMNTVEIKMSFSKATSIRMIIQDLSGKQVETFNFNVDAQTVSLPLNVNMPSGIYFIRISIGNEILTGKFYY